MSKSIAENVNSVLNLIRAAYNHSNVCTKFPTLVAVSKTKPVQDIIDAYKCGVRHFGENYIQELEAKASDEQILNVCPEIKWHYIGAIQKNKIPKFAKIFNLYAIETVSDAEVATKLNEKFKDKNSSLTIMVQINTSGEAVKQGISPDKLSDLVKHIIDNCEYLKFSGLMTIGELSASLSDEPNSDFLTLVKCRERLSEQLNIPLETIELSMGMSHDFEQAIKLGSTNVRVGSKIFGAREKVSNK